MLVGIIWFTTPPVGVDTLRAFSARLGGCPGPDISALVRLVVASVPSVRCGASHHRVCNKRHLLCGLQRDQVAAQRYTAGSRAIPGCSIGDVRVLGCPADVPDGLGLALESCAHEYEQDCHDSRSHLSNWSVSERQGTKWIAAGKQCFRCWSCRTRGGV